MRLSRLSLVVVSCLAASSMLVGCRGDKLATVELAGPDVVGEAKFTTTKQVVLWSDWDAVWKGRRNMDFPVTYKVEVLQAGALVGTVTCDTKSNSQGTCKIGVNFSEAYRAQCEVRMKCELPETKPGEITLRVSAKLDDPGNTKQVTQLNVNVREK